MSWADRSAELIWAASLAAIPVAILASVCSRWKWVRPATRHSLWFAVLATLLSPALISLWRPAWFRSERVLAVADSAVHTVLEPATSAYTALAPLDFAWQTNPLPASTLIDIPEATPLPRVEAPEPAPTVESSSPRPENRPESRPRRADAQPPRTDHPAPRTDLAAVPRTSFPAPSGSLLPAPPPASINAAASTAKYDFVGPLPPRSSLLTPEDLGLIQLSSTLTPDELGVDSRTTTPRTAAPVVAATPKPRQASTFAGFRDWLGHMLAARDAVAAVPAIPPILWIGGASLIASIWLTRFIRVQRMLSRAEPAPQPLVSLVRRLAVVAGVKRVPEVLVVEDRISPMIWCGLRPRLVIPRGLWRELDSRCQCAVIVHELSHLRRRDHRICILEALIGLVYWWHPIAWWARHRLRDEAESCCDAWVTTLLPGGRRAYAEALVATKSFLSLPGRSGAPGLSVVSGRTRQLARRITMVMTQRVAPRASVLGLSFALAVGAAGMLVMPGLACPPEDGKPAAKVVLNKQPESKKDVELKAKKERSAQGGGQAYFGEAPALEAMRAREQAAEAGAGEELPQPAQPGFDGQLDALKDMERSLQQMETRLKEMQRRLESLQGHPGAPRSQGGTLWSVPGVAVAPRAVTTVGPMGGVTAIAPRSGSVMTTTPRSASGNPFVVDNGQVEARNYSLSKGKLEALVALMARDDVPIFISSNDGQITVNATPAQHRTFQAFVQMIDPEAHGHAGSVNELHALTGVQGQVNAANRDALRAQTEQLRAASRELARQKSDSARQSEQVRRQIEKSREKSRKNSDPKSEEAIEAEIEAMECQLETLDCLNDQLDCQIESIESAIESINEAAENSEAPSAFAPAPPMAPIAPVAPAAFPAGAYALPAVPAAPAPARGATPAAPAPPAAPARGAAPAAPAPPAAPGAPMTTAGFATTPAVAPTATR